MSGTDLFDRPSTADDGQRNALDLYETANWQIASLLHHHPFARHAFILEPCSGGGAIAGPLLRAGYQVITNDLDPRHTALFHLDATGALWQHPGIVGIDYVITNPPFTVAIHVLEQAWLAARYGVAMLLRKTFLEPTGVESRPKPDDRGPWLAAHPPTRVIGLPRHNFRGKGTDSVSADWCIWEKHPDRSLPPFVIDYHAKSRRLG